LATPEEREDATEDRERETRCSPQSARILLESPARREADSDSASGLPSEDERDRDGQKRERNQRGRIMRTHSSVLGLQILDDVQLLAADPSDQKEQDKLDRERHHDLDASRLRRPTIGRIAGLDAR
jgi:hypothetical protein